MSRFIKGANDEFTIVMSTGQQIHTNNFDTVEGLREAIRDSFSGKGPFGNGLNVQFRVNSTDEFSDVVTCINPMHVAYIIDNRKD